MTAKIIDGKALATKVRNEVSKAVLELNKKGITPGLATVIVGNDAASSIYVTNKGKSAKEVGIKSLQYSLAESVSENELLKLINELNLNKDVDGILVQLPLPKQINSEVILDSIKPSKDVDGFNIFNAGNIYLNREGVIPCTPLGCLIMLRSIQKSLKGMNAVIIGRSNIVGKPMAQLLLNEDCTVTTVHSKSNNIQRIVKEADIIIAAVGIPNLVKASWVKKGAIVIDVGINRINYKDKTKLVGDVDFKEVQALASYITPVPGGVGPMTIACLLMNTVFQCSRKNNLSLPENLKNLY
ncbi:MAG TPA: bifunctional methylenetetrahydrofolate dehydrogenase/methenyltetrahydrofolate cyclohydrolase FolD [Alphaproteobacteria bacterium]|jgi:methylenetetrahydrofolate dehydrogenase (NADP+)/methenyltetrahydrofolate cyclohydrolase|nr:bifunctional methylenetetrahydrofolate dehydrogenase/methenyltetrahydrofolate cyclohydrolase FolD [Alphaproteobacteria bacterium]HIK87384.1 bifunctional methylenetetrahydrofolate dehydrogenase/methenyltetrahydrofolate cyclohydrolase FolD [Alphaproteobacteria bacterium]